MSVSEHTCFFTLVALRLWLTAVVVVFMRINWDALVYTNVTHATQRSPAQHRHTMMTSYMTDYIITYVDDFNWKETFPCWECVDKSKGITLTKRLTLKAIFRQQLYGTPQLNDVAAVLANKFQVTLHLRFVKYLLFWIFQWNWTYLYKM